MRIFVVTIFLVALAGCGDNSSTQNQRSPSGGQEWYAGGTLQQATLSEWRNGSARDRLASSADFAAVISRQLDMNIRNMDELRPIASNLERCISEVALEGNAGNMRVSEVAATCAILISQ